MNLIEYADSELMMMDLAHIVAGEINRKLMHSERASLALPGGTTPGPVMDALSATSLDWERVDVMLTDERWVPEDDPRSNARLLRERLLVDKAAKANFIPFWSDAGAPEECVPVAADKVRAAMPLTLVLLGMGEDMHTASLFPGAENLDTALSPNAPPLLALHPPGVPEARVTLTARVINDAMNKHLVIIGDAKREALEKARASGDGHVAPVAAVMRDLTVHWAKE
ncbi:6-phosphogluconolactonase [Maritimibacter fusiformis]|jgi:6-phosphogluconolactonase|uniref:6-phosphogluconolactonase n=1 Tax=Maritimibacter fusiformis TaxID=2603819 RepID=A0A5D0RPD3_9RHOB|nr:6-phosphogluconolactonase [Maritimibacter fusiformis]TYB82745.1 6-phosphogluconolactonase [Maritimibacter fusiformis]